MNDLKEFFKIKEHIKCSIVSEIASEKKQSQITLLARMKGESTLGKLQKRKLLSPLPQICDQRAVS